MSASPDFMTQLLQGNNPYGTNGALYSPLMGLAAGLLQAGGPSRMPVSLGQALGQGLQTGQQFQSAGLQNAMQQLMLGQNIQGLQAMQQAAQGDAPIPPAFQQYAPQPADTTQQAPAASTGTAPSTSTPQPKPAPVQDTSNSSMPTPASQVPPDWLKQVAADTQRLRVLEANPWNPNAVKAAADLRAQMGASFFDVPSNMIPGGAVPGQQYQINELGERRTLGEPAIKMIPVAGPNGTIVNVPWDSRTNKIIDPTGITQPKDYSKPLNGSEEDYAQRVAKYQVVPPTVSSRFPGAADINARADYLIKQAGGDGLDATTFPSKMAAMKSLAAGKDYQQNSSYSTIQTHLATALQAFDALHNGDVQDANRLTQWAGTKFGKSATQNAKVVNDIVVGELAKVLAQGGQVTDSVRSEASGDLEPYLSKGQYHGAVQYIQQLIAGKMNTSYINARARHIPDDVFLSGLTPEARQQLQQFRATHPDQFSGNTPTTGNVKSLSDAELLRQLGVSGG